MLSLETPVARLVLDHSERASVFDRYRIDYCCEGARPLRVACEERGIDPALVLRACEVAMQGRSSMDTDPRTLSTTDVITKVIARHHLYLHRALPFLVGLSQKVARVHGEREPTLRELARVVNRLATTLLNHLNEEERELFPELIAGEPSSGRASALLLAMREEHATVGQMVSTMRATANEYATPDWACTSYGALMAELAHLEADTLRHIHVENHVLLPRFVAA